MDNGIQVRREKSNAVVSLETIVLEAIFRKTYEGNSKKEID